MQAFKADIFAWLNKYALQEFIYIELLWIISSLINISRTAQMEWESMRVRVAAKLTSCVREHTERQQHTRSNREDRNVCWTVTCMYFCEISVLLWDHILAFSVYISIDQIAMFAVRRSGIQQCKHSMKFSGSFYLHGLYTDCKCLFVFPI